VRATGLIAAALAAACSSAPRGPADGNARVVSHECAIAGVAAAARCATVTVPESASGARRIDLRVVVLPARSENPARDPVVPLAGGPGQGAADIAPVFARRLDFLRDDRDIVLIDQRGTGQSNGLHCASASSTAELMGKLFDPERLSACRDELSRRADLTQYTTAAAAADYEHVLDALGYAQVNVVGTSYGSRLALELARRFPERIRTLTLEGVVTPAFGWPAMGAPDAEAALEALLDDCAADRACAAAFPHARQDVERAFARLAGGPATVAVRDLATGAIGQVRFGSSDLAYATRGILYGDEALALPLWFRGAAAGDFRPFAQAYVDRARRLEGQIAQGVHLGVYCAEDLPYVDWTRARAAAAGTRIGTYLIDQYRAACEVWPRAAVTASFREPVHSSIPTLLISGRRDPVSPPRTARQATRTLPKSRLLVWRHGAHGTDGVAARDCRPTMQREFVRTADAAQVRPGCMTHEPPLPFVLPPRDR
jgi:pimeloyl-ACP methyl ester carboxylesterase